MDVTFYTVLVYREFEGMDEDFCPAPQRECFYEQSFTSKKEAVRQAQRHHDRQPLNGYVHDVWAKVIRKTVGTKGQTGDRQVYFKRKHVPTSIYGRPL